MAMLCALIEHIGIDIDVRRMKLSTAEPLHGKVAAIFGAGGLGGGGKGGGPKNKVSATVNNHPWAMVQVTFHCLFHCLFTASPQSCQPSHFHFIPFTAFPLPLGRGWELGVQELGDRRDAGRAAGRLEEG